MLVVFCVWIDLRGLDVGLLIVLFRVFCRFLCFGGTEAASQGDDLTTESLVFLAEKLIFLFQFSDCDFLAVCIDANRARLIIGGREEANGGKKRK